MKDLKHSGRRAFLKLAGGATASLPLLEFTHGHAFAAGDTPRRFLTVFSHGGTISNMQKGPRGNFYDGTTGNHGFDYWKPADEGEALRLGPIMQPLEDHVGKLLVLQGIDNMAAIQQDQYLIGGHGTSNMTALTAANLAGSGDDSTSQGPSIDHVLADRLAMEYPVAFSRVHLMVGGHQYGSPYYSGPNARSSGERDPQTAFATLFDGVTGDAPDPAAVRRRTIRGSVVDGVLEGFSRFRNVVSQNDVRTVDAHLAHLRALEREIANLELTPACSPPDVSGGGDLPGNVAGELHVRIILAALRCGLTNVANLEIADILTPWTPAGIRVESAFDIGHSLGHTAREVGESGSRHHELDAWLAETLDNRRWRMTLMRQLLDGLDDANFMEGDATMLDNSLVLYTSEFSEPSGHVAKNVPTLLAGSAGGAFRTGRHLDYNEALPSYETRQSNHNLFTSILQAFGGTEDHFGSDHSVLRGPLPGLT
jgi:hypothetical protein